MTNVTIGGKTYPLKATMRAWRAFEKSTGVKVNDVDNKDITLIPELVYYFVKDGCAAQGMKFTMDVEEWLGQIEVTDLETIAAVLVEVMGASSEKKTKLTKVNH